MPTVPSKGDERILLGAFGAVAVAFFLANAYTQHATGRIDEASKDIAFNSTPSIQRLAAVRTSVRHAEFLLVAAVTLDEQDRSQLHAALAQITEDANAYLTLPTFPGETALWRELSDSIREFEGAVERALARRDAGEGRAARASLAEVGRCADRVSAAAFAAIEFNAANGRDLALRIMSTRQRVEWVGYGLTTSLALLTMMAGGLVHGAVRRHRALVESYAAMQDRRATELEQFAARAAHDILNPVSATRLALELATKRGVAEEKGRELVHRALRNLHRIQTLIDGLLQFARAGASPTPGASADVAVTLEDVVDGMRPAAEAAGVELRLDAVPPCRACCSAGVLTSVVANLAQNAMKYMGDATSRRITFRASVAGPFVHLEVEDSGPGIPPELLGDIFRPYVRGPSQGKPGLGLGLATVKRLCETHGGRVGVRSVVGVGSVFWLELPLLEEGELAAPAVEDRAGGRSSR